LKTGIVLAAIMAISVATSLAYADEIDVRFLPSKLIEGSDGTMHIFAMEAGQIVPKKITGVTVTSLDSSILHIQKIQDGGSFITEASVKTGKPGTTKLYIAAPGYTSKEIPVTVYGNKNNAAKLLLKVTPDTFVAGGTKEGYVAVQLADEDGFPVIAKKDTTILLSTANRDMLEFANPNLIIKSGEYYAYSKFFAKKSGSAVVYATSNGIETKSATVSVTEEDDLSIEMFTYPKTISTQSGSKGFIIAQLQDSSGRPVMAQKDITVYYKVTDSAHSETSNYSNNYKQKNSGYFTIPSGSYMGYTQYSLAKGIEDTYTVSISAEDPLTIETEAIEAKNLKIIDDKLVKFETIPVLATGKSEMVGILYLEDESGNPVNAKKDLMIKIDSSNADSLAVTDVSLPMGEQVALVFGKTGNSVKSDLRLRPVVSEGELTDVTMFGPDKDSLVMTAKPLITEILAGTDFPIVIYLKEGDDLTPFPGDYNVFVSPNEYVETAPNRISAKDTVVLVDAKSLKKGTASVSFEVGDFKSDSSIVSVSPNAASIVFDHAKTIFVGNNDVFSVQLVNSQGLPTYATDNVDISLVVKEDGLIDTPSTITIEKGAYYALFDAAPKNGGETDISLLSKELPLLTGKLKITSLTPVITMSGPNAVNATESFMVKISANANGKPLTGMDVSWSVDGGVVQMSDTRTGTDGSASAAIIPQGTSVNAKATVSGQWYSSTTASKTIAVSHDSGEAFVQEENIEETYQTPEIFGIDPVLIAVPIGIGVAGFMLKRKGQLKIMK